MTARGLSLIAVSAVLTAIANLALRGGLLRFGQFDLGLARLKDSLLGVAAQPLFVLGVIFYGLAAMAWFGAVSIENLSSGYPVLVGATFVLVAIGAALFFGESFNWPKLIGMAMILCGIIVMARV